MVKQLTGGWHLYARTPEASFVWPVGPPPLDEDVVNAARVLAGFPTHENWIDDGSGYDLSHSPGDPHPGYVELHQPVYGTLADLRKVDRTAVAEHAAARAQWHRDRHLDAVKAALGALDDDALAEVLAHPSVAKRLEG
jgi:hypothetical protein